MLQDVIQAVRRSTNRLDYAKVIAKQNRVEPRSTMLLTIRLNNNRNNCVNKEQEFNVTLRLGNPSLGFSKYFRLLMSGICSISLACEAKLWPEVPCSSEYKKQTSLTDGIASAFYSPH